MSVDGRTAVAVQWPSLLGAILIKARALAAERKDKFDSDRQDLILLLSLVEDPRTIASEGQLSEKERTWLRSVEGNLALSESDLGALFGRERLTRAGLAFRLLAG